MLTTVLLQKIGWFRSLSHFAVYLEKIVYIKRLIYKHLKDKCEWILEDSLLTSLPSFLNFVLKRATYWPSSSIIEGIIRCGENQRQVGGLQGGSQKQRWSDTALCVCGHLVNYSLYGSLYKVFAEVMKNRFEGQSKGCKSKFLCVWFHSRYVMSLVSFLIYKMEIITVEFHKDLLHIIHTETYTISYT